MALQPEQPAASTPTTSRARQQRLRVIDRLIDRLGAQPPSPLADEPLTQLVRDLLRTSALGQQPRDRLAEHRV
jgi:hypothetical protein